MSVVKFQTFHVLDDRHTLILLVGRCQPNFLKCQDYTSRNRHGKTSRDPDLGVYETDYFLAVFITV